MDKKRCGGTMEPLSQTAVDSKDIENRLKVKSTNSEDTEDEGSRSSLREQWSNQWDFLLSAIGFCVGLGNVWRFPYLCYKNGGGAFLVPYLLSLVLAAGPTFFLELSLGQYMSQGGLGVWNICPVFQGIGVAATGMLCLTNIYYIVILAWSANYMWWAFSTQIPWSHCNNDWNTKNCVAFGEQRFNISLNNATLINETCADGGNGSCVGLYGNYSSVRDSPGVDPVIEFWERKILQLSSGIDEPGHLVWQLVVCLSLAWVVVYFCIWKGVKWTGKVVYVTALLPYCVLGVLLIRGLTLEGSLNGVVTFLKPDFSRLTDPGVWIDAGTQICYSFALGINAQIALGSYNKFNNNVYRQWLFISTVNCATSFFAGFVIFSVLGFMAHEQGVDINKVASSGPGLAFIVYPKAVTQMPLPQLWAVLFFFMIICVGLDSQFVGVEAFITVLKDLFPQLYKGHRRELVAAAVALVSFLIGLSMVSQGGMYTFQIFDYYNASGMLLVACFEVIAIAWVYGVTRYYDNLEMMIGFRLNPFLKICWLVMSPLLTTGIFISNWIRFEGVTYNRTYIYPGWAQAIGLCMAIGPMLCIPGFALLKLALTPGSLAKRWKTVTTPILLVDRIPPHWRDAQKLKIVSMTTSRTLFTCGSRENENTECDHYQMNNEV